ncbi:MAG: endonuclease domain-containing protein [bacterium]
MGQDRNTYARAYHKKRYRNDPAFREKERLRRNLSNLKHYGITLIQYNDMVRRQNGKCLICDGFKKLVIDHNHVTGKVRGLICRACNHFLIAFDNAQIYNRILSYLKCPN